MIYKLIEKCGGEIPCDISYDIEREMQQEEKYKDVDVTNVINHCMLANTFFYVCKMGKRDREIYDDYMERMMKALEIRGL